MAKEKANAEPAASDRVDYRYIDSTIKLIVILMKTFEINKIDFMSRVFEAIFETLHNDHSARLTAFNQKPYLRMLRSILTAFKQGQPLLLIADLFHKINPNKYPAFAFAWLDLVASPLFMPSMLRRDAKKAEGDHENHDGHNH